MAIRSFGSRATRRFAKGERRRLPPELAAKVDRVLQFLADGSSPADLREVGYRVHRLTGDRRGRSAVAVSGGWRVVFRFQDGDAYDVEVVDYHRS